MYSSFFYSKEEWKTMFLICQPIKCTQFKPTEPLPWLLFSLNLCVYFRMRVCIYYCLVPCAYVRACGFCHVRIVNLHSHCIGKWLGLANPRFLLFYSTLILLPISDFLSLSIYLWVCLPCLLPSPQPSSAPPKFKFIYSNAISTFSTITLTLYPFCFLPHQFI